MIPRLALALALLGLPPLAPAPGQQPTQARAEAKRVGLAERVGEWKLVRYVPGEQAHFLFASQKRAFSLFVSEMKKGAELKPQPGWRAVALGKGKTGFLHQDARAPERNALAWRHGTQRWMILGRLRPDELAPIAAKL